MKRPYEKPTLTDLSLPTARAGGRLPGGGVSPQGVCHTGFNASPGGCVSGDNPGASGLCISGASDTGGSACAPGNGVRCVSGSQVF